MRWRKRGLIFTVDHQHEWMAHHASMPTVDRVNDELLRIYFSPRDQRGRSRVGFIDVEAENPANVIYVHDRPALDLGKLGTFDDSGVMPSSIVTCGDKQYLYYIGWNQGVTVPYRNAVGLAVSEDGGRTFERVFDGPIVDRAPLEPYFCSTPLVLVDEGTWKMWYTSSTGYLPIGGRPEPVYQIKYAESSDGRTWARPNITCIEYARDGEANARPCVIREHGLYRMWYCYRSSVDYRTDKRHSYRLGYAESGDGLHWDRLDHLVGIERPDAGWDSQMMAYPFVYEHRGVKHLLYNGNGFGETGIGHAVLVEDDRVPRRLPGCRSPE